MTSSFKSALFDFKNASAKDTGKHKTQRKKRNLQESDTGCPESEPYVAFAADHEWSGTEMEITDMEVRPSDRMQYVTGTLTDKDGWYSGGS